MRTVVYTFRTNNTGLQVISAHRNYVRHSRNSSTELLASRSISRSPLNNLVAGLIASSKGRGQWCALFHDNNQAELVLEHNCLCEVDNSVRLWKYLIMGYLLLIFALHTNFCSSLLFFKVVSIIMAFFDTFLSIQVRALILMRSSS